VLTRACYWILFRARWIQSTNSPPISLSSTLILSFYLHLGLLSGLFPSGFLTKTVHACFISRACYTSHPSRPLDLKILIIFDKQYKSWGCTLCNISIMFSGILNICATFWARNQVLPIQNSCNSLCFQVCCHFSFLDVSCEVRTKMSNIPYIFLSLLALQSITPLS